MEKIIRKIMAIYKICRIRMGGSASIKIQKKEFRNQHN